MKHNPTVRPVNVAVLGRRHQMSCRCGAHTPPMSREGAELARERHLYETDPSREFVR